MAEERPPSWVPVDQSVGQVPIAITQDVDNTISLPKPGQDVHALAAQIIRDNQPVINRFVAMQRQQIELGEKDFHSSVLPLKDLTVFYRNVGGLERMHYHITPKVEEPPETPEPQPAAPEPSKPPEEEKQPAPPDLRAPEPEVPKPAEPPEFEEPKPPEEERQPEEEVKLPEEEKPPEEEKLPEEEERKGSPEFIEIDIPCFLAVEFGDKDEDGGP